MSDIIDEKEIEKFAAISQEWWNVGGKFKPLHAMNIVRLEYIKEQIESQFPDIKKLKILDVGCGGGLASIPLSNMGADVLAIDAAAQNIEIAKKASVNCNGKILFQHKNLEDVKDRFDVVISLEVIEHVKNIEKFIELLASRVKPGGLLILSTINRNVKSYMLAIVAAEYLLRWVDIGTHEYSKFVKPSEIHSELKKYGFKISDMKGMEYSPISSNWSLSNNIDVNYILTSRNPNLS